MLFVRAQEEARTRALLREQWQSTAVDLVGVIDLAAEAPAISVPVASTPAAPSPADANNRQRDLTVKRFMVGYPKREGSLNPLFLNSTTHKILKSNMTSRICKLQRSALPNVWFALSHHTGVPHVETKTS